MPFFDGRVAWGEETTYGTAVARTTFSRFHSGSALEHIIDQDRHSVYGRSQIDRFFKKSERGDGKLQLPLYVGQATGGGLGKLLKHLLGLYSVSGAGPYTHLFTMGADEPPFGAGAVSTAQSLTVELDPELPDAGKEALIGSGCMVNAATVKIAGGDEPMIELDVLPQKVVQGAKTGSPVYPALDSYLALPVLTSIVVDGGDISAVCPGIEFTVNNSRANDVLVVGSIYPKQPRVRGVRRVTGTLHRLWETTPAPSADTLYGKFLSGAALSIVVTVTIGANDYLKFTMGNVKALGKTPPPVEGGYMPFDVEFEAMYDPTVVASVVNTALRVEEKSTTLTTY